jgi:hypothetical protein
LLDGFIQFGSGNGLGFQLLDLLDVVQQIEYL